MYRSQLISTFSRRVLTSSFALMLPGDPSDNNFFFSYWWCFTILGNSCWWSRCFYFVPQLQSLFSPEERLTRHGELSIRPKEDVTVHLLFAPTRVACMLAKLEIKPSAFRPSQPGVKFTVRVFWSHFTDSFLFIFTVYPHILNHQFVSSSPAC